MGAVDDLGVRLLANSSTSKRVEFLSVFVDVGRIVRIDVVGGMSVQNDGGTNRFSTESLAETVEEDFRCATVIRTAKFFDVVREEDVKIVLYIARFKGRQVCHRGIFGRGVDHGGHLPILLLFLVCFAGCECGTWRPRG
jgi:hypothetical protein